MGNFYTISIDGIKRNIISFEALRANEPGENAYGTACLTLHQYLSMLFNNLGYSKCPNDLSFLKEDILTSKKAEIIDYPLTIHRLMLISESTTLYHLLIVIANWIHAGLEKGNIVDPIKSSKVPNKIEEQFNLDNHMRVKRKCNLRNKIEIWDKSNIFMRRQYNLSPHVDPDYFDNSIVDFESWSKVIKVNNPKDIFISCLINPDVFFSVIRDCEKQAYQNALEQSLNSYRGIPDDRDIVSRFIPLFQSQCKRIGAILKAKGPKGFLVEENNTVNKTLDPVIYDSMLDNTTILADDIKREIANTTLDGDHKSYILQYVEPYSCEFIENIKDESLRISTYKKLYYTLSQIKANAPELLNRKEKFTFSKPFYINDEVFALYNKYKKEFFITTPELIIYEMSPEEALKYYKDKYNKNIYLDPDEVGDSFVSKKAPEIDLAELEKEKCNYVMITISDPVEESMKFNPEIYVPESYSLNLDKYIE